MIQNIKKTYLIKDGINLTGGEWNVTKPPNAASSVSVRWGDVTGSNRVTIVFSKADGGNSYAFRPNSSTSVQFNGFGFRTHQPVGTLGTLKARIESAVYTVTDGDFEKLFPIVQTASTSSIYILIYPSTSTAGSSPIYSISDFYLTSDFLPTSTFSSISSTAKTDGSIFFSLERSSEDYMHTINIYDGDNLVYTNYGKFDGFHGINLGNQIANSHPTENSFPLTVELITYEVDAEGNREEVGRADPATVIMEVSDEIKPKILSVDFEPSGTTLDGYIQGYSKAAAGIHALGYRDHLVVIGPDVVEYSLTVDGKTYTSDSWQIITDILSTAGNLPVTVTVTDQRGRTATWSGTLPVMQYSKPSLTVKECFRSDASGAADDNSHYLKVSVTPVFSSLDGQNSLTASAAVSGTTYPIDPAGSVIGGTLNPDASYIVSFSITDILGNTATASFKVPTRVWAMQFMPNGMGVAFGKAATEGKALQVPEDWKIQIGDVALTLEELSRLLKLHEGLPTTGGTITGDLSVTGDLSTNQFTAEGVSTKQLSIDKANIIPQDAEVNLTLPAVSGEIALKGEPVLKKVWENSAPTANFNAQSVDLSGTGSWFMVKIQHDATHAFFSYHIVPADVPSVLHCAYHGGNKSRLVTISGTSATFETGYSGTSGGTSHAIPVEIYTINW